MADVDALVEKWFIDTNGTRNLLDLAASEAKNHWLPPQTRHEGASLTDHTTGNDVTALLDGENILPKWAEGVVHLTNNHGDAQLLHSGWIARDINVKAGKSVSHYLGQLTAKTDEVYIALSDHWTNATDNRKFANSVGIDTAAVDSRYPDVGSNHAKYTVFKDGTDDYALVGSADLWGPARAVQAHDQLGGQHELSVTLRGPAVADVQQSFVNRWNDETRDDVKGSLWHPVSKSTVGSIIGPYAVWTEKTPPELSANAVQTTTTGTHAVQVLQTFGIDHDDETYSWANGSGGEFTVWAARLRALSKATDYIYVEDQYFVPFGVPGTKTYQLAMKADHKWAPFTHLKERLAAGVDVFVVTNPELDGRFANTAAFARTDALVELKTASEQSGAGDLVVASLEVGGDVVNTHAKLVVVDDEYVALGSANFNRRSATNDGELALGIVDGDETLVPTIRSETWGEHLGVSPSSLGDLAAAKATYKDRVTNETGRLRALDIPDEATDEPWNQKFGLSQWDHYAGPADRTPEADQ
ncbi:phospholipase D-like domain-containing protein [Salinirubellus salinus]|uniref:Phospholipase D-like domain-containing protein n=1 Tax=Salinirubellus salinus TaxID=1364945 RepID=A0A9E7QZ42_9EURY|nr:phospholipase D-like domain-containing protein [Salinirubellus salinus]UWM52724.1 phospholipase D-like domain-containing protein [Salinirubellus salinus]